jgi:hypothetical protein
LRVLLTVEAPDFAVFLAAVEAPRVVGASGTLSRRRGDPGMQATIGDRICIHGNIVGHPDKNGEIVEVHGTGGEPPYLVKFDDGHTRLIFPGPDAVIEHPTQA